jgi:hypothetical protein
MHPLRVPSIPTQPPTHCYSLSVVFFDIVHDPTSRPLDARGDDTRTDYQM